MRGLSNGGVGATLPVRPGRGEVCRTVRGTGPLDWALRTARSASCIRLDSAQACVSHRTQLWGGRRVALSLMRRSRTVSATALLAALLAILLAFLPGGAAPARAQENTEAEAARRQAVLTTLPPDAARRV